MASEERRTESDFYRLAALRGKRLLFLGWKDEHPSVISLYFADRADVPPAFILRGWPSATGTALWCLDDPGTPHPRCYGASFASGENPMLGIPPITPMNRPSWCENPLKNFLYGREGAVLQWHTRRPVALTLTDGFWTEHVAQGGEYEME